MGLSPKDMILFSKSAELLTRLMDGLNMIMSGSYFPIIFIPLLLTVDVVVLSSYKRKILFSDFERDTQKEVKRARISCH